uniref:cadherin-related family member 5-like isoform X2 n=1 Tax=Monopterus albus TaxID=43700 RepID=UPI0009B383C0|nr:cadherin-related family member 5-like isoform X2 [Monopterus albus]
MSTNPSMSTDSLPMTTKPSTTSEGSNSTTDPSLTSESGISTTNPSLTSEGTAHPPPVIVPSGDYTVVDMAALGATLGILLFISLVVIGVLVHCIRKGKADWRKIYEANVFRSSLGQSSGAPKKGIQYTNEAFQNDEDGGSMGFNGPKGGSVMADGAPRKVVDIPLNEAKVRSLASLHALLPDNTSQAGSDKVDSEKEVKPILTKERRMEEGYKAVWFKEDIDPAAKEEVVIIPDSREDDSEEEDGEQLSSSRDEDEDHNQPIKTRKVGFADADLDSGLGVKMDDTAEDSHSDEVSTVNLDHL